MDYTSFGRLTGLRRFRSKMTTTQLADLITARNLAAPNQRKLLVGQFVVKEFLFHHWIERIEVFACDEALNKALLSIRTPDEFIPALEKAAASYDRDWFVDNGADANLEWMSDPELHVLATFVNAGVIDLVDAALSEDSDTDLEFEEN